MANFNLDNYVPVNDRLTLFYRDFPNGRVTTEIVQHELESGFVLFKASVYRNIEDAEPSATGHAFESQAQGYVNKTSYIENCETSAVGRALALLGYEISKGIASREEMAKVERHSQPKQEVKQHPKTQNLSTLERIRKAESLIRELGGEVESFNPTQKTEQEKQAELESLREQYERLKQVKAV